MTNYLNSLVNEANKTYTLNGAVTNASTLDHCLDMFSTAGAMRHNQDSAIINRFDRAYIQNPELAMKLLFHIRDIRGGMGERRIFRTIIRHVAFTWPQSARKNVEYISEYGRWDDLMCLMGSPCQKQVVACIREQLRKDEEAIEAAKGTKEMPHVSLLAKWLPSCNTSSRRTRGQARVMMKALDMKEADYRRMLTRLRAASCLTERYLSRKKVDRIHYPAVPGHAMLKYRKAFIRRDGERFDSFVQDVNHGKSSIHAGTLSPYELIQPFGKDWWKLHDLSETENRLLETMWKHQDADIYQQNAIVVADGSGSMYWCDRPVPALVAQSLALYYAERNKGLFRNRFITFSEDPQLIRLPNASLQDKLRYIRTFNDCANTNIQAVFDLLLNAAIKAHAPQDEMPSTIYIVSDMEFDACSNNRQTNYEAFKEKFERHGYKLPVIVFHNVNSWQMQAPVTAHTRGTALTSGYNTNVFKRKVDQNTTPLQHMLDVLNDERYARIHA